MISIKNNKKYHAFISYRHADNKEQGRQWATWLHQAIETYEVPADLVGQKNGRDEEIPARIYPIFRDEEELPADADLGGAITRALDETRLLVVLCSPRAVESTYVAEEIDYFKKLGHSDKIIAAMIDGEPNTSWDKGKQQSGFKAEDECFPIPLQFEYDQKGNRTTKHAEPIAADFRINNEGIPEQGWTSVEAYRQSLKSSSLDKKSIQGKVDLYHQQQHLMLLKIIAGVLGVPLGELTQRDKEYQLEQEKLKAIKLRKWLAAVGLLAVFAIVASIFAYNKQQQAEVAEQLASQERDQAKTQRDTALMTQSNFLMDLARQQVEQGRYDIALLLGLNALPGSYGGERPLLTNIVPLRDAVQKNIKHSLYQEEGDVVANSFSTNGKKVAQLTSDGISIWLVEDGKKESFFNTVTNAESLEYAYFDNYLLVVDNNELYVLDSSDGKVVYQFSAANSILDVSFSPKGKQVALATTDGFVDIWPLDDKKKPNKKPKFHLAHGDKINSVSFDHTGDFLLTASDDGVASIWSVSKGERTKNFNHSQAVKKAVFSTSDKFIATLSGNSVIIWDAVENEVVRRVNGSSEFSDVVFNKNENAVLAVGAPKETGLYSFIKESSDEKDNSASAFAKDKLANFIGIKTPFVLAKMSPDQKYSLLVHENDQAFIIDNNDFSIIQKLKHDGKVESIAFSPDNQFVLTGSEDNTGVLWKLTPLNSDTSKKLFDSGIVNVEFKYLRRHQKIMVGYEGFILKSLNKTSAVTEGETDGSSKILDGKAPLNLFISENEKAQVLHTQQGETIVWDFELEKQLYYSKGVLRYSGYPKLSSTGQSLALVTDDNKLKLVDLASGKDQLVKEFDTKKLIKGIAFSPDDSTLLVYFVDHYYLVDTSTGQITKEYELQQEIENIEYAPNGEDILLVGKFDRISYRGANSNQIKFEFVSDSKIAYTEFSPDGKKIAVGTLDDKIFMLSSESGKEIYQLHHSDLQKYAMEVALLSNRSIFAKFSPSGQFIITGSDDHMPIVWRVSNGQKIKHLSHNSVVVGAEFLDDEQSIVTAAALGGIRQWNIQLSSDLNKIAVDALPLNRSCLSPVERTQFFLPELTSEQWIDRGCAQFSKEAKLAIEKGADSPLFLALKNDDESLFERLINAGYDLREYNSKGRTLLVEAIITKKQKWIDKILAISEDVDYPTKQELPPIVIAAFMGDASLVEKLLDKGANPEPKDSDGSTILHSAVSQYKYDKEKSNRPIVELLLSRGMDINALDDNGNTPLHIALRDKQKEMVLLLIKHGADVNVANSDLWTPIMRAISWSEVEIVERLLEKGVDAIKVEKDQWNALHFSVQSSKEERSVENMDIILQLILNTGIDVNLQNKSGATAIWLAVANNRTEAVRVLIEKGADLELATGLGNTPLLEAVEERRFKLFNLLMDAGANHIHQNNEGLAALNFVGKGEGDESKELIAMAKRIIEAGGDINGMSADKNTPLLEAVKSGYLEVSSLLIKNGADPDLANHERITPLMQAANMGNLQIIDLLLAEVKNIDYSMESGWNALLSTVDGNNSNDQKVLLEIATKLLAAGANVNSKIKSGKSALHLAILNNRKNLFDLFIRSNSNINSVDENGITPLIDAASNVRVEMISDLIVNGANVNIENNQGWSPLLVLAETKNSKDQALMARLMEQLIKAGALLDAKNSGGFTAVNLATLRNKSETLRVLLQHGAPASVPNNDGWTAIMQAINMGENALFDQLLKAKVELNSSDKSGWTALHLTANESNKGGDEINAEFAKSLIKEGANKNLQTKSGSTAIALAVFNNRQKVFNVLLKAGVDLDLADNDGWTPLMRAVNRGFPGMAESLIEAGADVNAAPLEGWTPLHLTVNGNSKSSERINLQLAKALLAKGAEINPINDAGNTPLYLAVWNDQPAIFQLLLNSKADVNIANGEGYTPLLKAITDGRKDMADTLIDRVKDINQTSKDGWNALHLTLDGNGKGSKGDNYEIAQRLVEKGIRLNQQTKNQNSALHLSIMNDNMPIFNLLMGHSAETDAADIDGFTPLMRAISAGNLHAFNRLIESKARTSGSSDNGWNVLHLTVDNSAKGDRSVYPDMTTRLLEQGVEINSKTNDGETALHLAVWNNFPDAFDLLIKKGANINNANNEGWTPLMRAVVNKRYNMVFDLISAGAKIYPKNSDGKNALMIASELDQDERVVQRIVELLKKGEKK